MNVKNRRVLRIETRVSRTGAHSISNFLRFATTEELWWSMVALWPELPADIQADYKHDSTYEGLSVYFDPPELIKPMMRVMLERWQLSEPAHCTRVLHELSVFLHRARIKAVGETLGDPR